MPSKMKLKKHAQSWLKTGRGRFARSGKITRMIILLLWLTRISELSQRGTSIGAIVKRCWKRFIVLWKRLVFTSKQRLKPNNAMQYRGFGFENIFLTWEQRRILHHNKSSNFLKYDLRRKWGGRSLQPRASISCYLLLPSKNQNFASALDTYVWFLICWNQRHTSVISRRSLFVVILRY